MTEHIPEVDLTTTHLVGGMEGAILFPNVVISTGSSINTINSDNVFQTELIPSAHSFRKAKTALST